MDGSVSDAGGSPKVALSQNIVDLILIAIDVALVIVSSIGSNYVYKLISNRNTIGIEFGLGIGLLAAIIFSLQCKVVGGYKIVNILTFNQEFSRIAIAWVAAIAFITAVLFLFQLGAIFSRGAFLTFSLATLLVLCLSRLLASRIIHSLIEHGSISGRRVVVIGEPKEMESLRAPDLLMRFGLRELARFSIGDGPELKALSGEELRTLERAVRTARVHRAQELVVALRWSRSDFIRAVEDRLRLSPLPLRLLPDQVVRSLEERWSFSPIGLVPTVELHRAPLNRSERAVKRLCDLILAVVVIILLTPLLLLVGVAVKLDSAGPIVFRQRRVGFDSRVFSIYKFRTMTVLEDGPKLEQTRANDPRVTNLGRILRQSSIDELPQLFNVLKGDMSLVGPRPHAIAHDNEFGAAISSYAFRHHVKPGITGWAQVNGQRGETKRIEDMEKRIELDLWYINNWSLMLDLRIMWRTCFEVLRQNAY